MESLARFSGILGIVVFLFGILGGLVVRSFSDVFVIWLHLLVGITLILLWFFTHGLRNISSAGSVLTGRSARFGSMASAYIAVFAGIMVLANLYANWNNKRFDLTEAGVHSLSSRSVKLAEELKQPLRLVAVTGVDQEADDRATRELLERYRDANREKVSVEVLDARKNVVEVSEQLGMKPGNVLYVEYGEKNSADKSVSRLNEISEEAITNSVVNLTRGEAKKIYYIQGHGEPDLESAQQGGAKQFSDSITDEHLKIAPLLLLQTGKVPADAAAVILAGPKRAMQQSERESLYEYATHGGRLVLLSEPENRDVSDVRELASKFGIEVGSDIIIDEQLRLFGGPQLAVQFVAQELGTSEIVSRINRKEPPIFTLASSVKPVANPAGSEGSAADATYDELLKSGPSSWAESDVKMIFESDSPTAALDAGDKKGPISIAVSYERKLDKKTEQQENDLQKVSRVVVFGDSSWIENGNIGMTSNRDLILNAVNWSVGQTGGAAIEPRGYRQSKISSMMANDFKVILAISFLLPELLLIIGLFVWWRRRTV